MKTVLVLSVLLCAAFAAPAEDIEMAAEAAVEVPQEQMVAEPENVIEEIADPEPLFYCPSGWRSYGSRCFTAVNTRKSWYAAKDHCNILGGNLAAATSDGEYRFLQVLANDARLRTAWLGGFYLQGQWMWTDQEGFYYTNWSSQYCSDADNPCLYLHDDTVWGKSRCSSGYGFICSKRM